MDEETPAVQTEINVGAPGALTDAVEAAIRTASTANQTPPDAATVAAARAHAQQILGGEDPETAAGFRDMQNVTASMGLPATRATFHHMITASGKRGGDKLDATREVTEFSPVTEVGCMKIDFINIVTQKPDVAYILLDQCPKGHNLGAQISKLKPLVPEGKWPEVLKHMSMLIQIGRSVYGNTTRQHLPLIRKLFDLAADDKCEKYLDFRVDQANTTLYVDADWPNRVGIFVRLEAEVAAVAAAENAK